MVVVVSSDIVVDSTCVVGFVIVELVVKGVVVVVVAPVVKGAVAVIVLVVKSVVVVALVVRGVVVIVALVVRGVVVVVALVVEGVVVVVALVVRGVVVIVTLVVKGDGVVSLAGKLVVVASVVVGPGTRIENMVKIVNYLRPCKIICFFIGKVQANTNTCGHWQLLKGYQGG